MSSSASTASSSSGKFLLLEVGRGIAALFVVLMHAANLMNVPHFSGHVGLGGAFNFGYVGVDFFFVLSGFVITHAHLGDIGRPERVPLYLWRRFSRIYPIYWISLALAVMVGVVGRVLLGRGGEAIDFTAVDFFATVLLLNIAEPKFLGVAWSLQYEVMFYVLFVVAILHRRAMQLLLALWACALLLRWAGVLEATCFGLLTGHTFQFVLGALVAVTLRRRGAVAQPRAWFAGAALLLLLAILAERTVLTAHGDAGRVLLGLGSAAMIIALAGIDHHGLWRAPRALSLLGSASYSVYLTHIIFISVTYSLLRVAGLYHRLPELLVYVIAVVVAVGASTALGLLVELPLVARLKHLSRQSPRALQARSSS